MISFCRNCYTSFISEEPQELCSESCLKKTKQKERREERKKTKAEALQYPEKGAYFILNLTYEEQSKKNKRARPEYHKEFSQLKEEIYQRWIEDITRLQSFFVGEKAPPIPKPRKKRTPKPEAPKAQTQIPPFKTVWFLPIKVENSLRVLGLSWPCSLENVFIKQRELAAKHHPDRNKNSKKATQKMQEVNEAVLTIKQHLKQG